MHRRKHGLHKPPTAAFLALAKARDQLQRTGFAVRDVQQLMGAALVLLSPYPDELFLGSPFISGT